MGRRHWGWALKDVQGFAKWKDEKVGRRGSRVAWWE